MKQTAVEWLVEQINNDSDTIFYDRNLHPFEQYVNQAKAMEKEQIIESWDNGYANGYDLGKYDDEPNPDDAEQYYNETFKSE